MRKLLVGVILPTIVALAPAILADEARSDVLTTLVSSFGALDKEWRGLLRDSDDGTADPIPFAASLRRHATTFHELSTTVDGNLHDALKEYSKIFRDIAGDLQSSPELATEALDSIRFKLVFVAHVAQGVAVGVFDSSADRLMLTNDEASHFLRHAEEIFGDKIEGDEAINGDTPFAQAVSLINNFIAIAAKGTGPPS